MYKIYFANLPERKFFCNNDLSQFHERADSSINWLFGFDKKSRRLEEIAFDANLTSEKATADQQCKAAHDLVATSYTMIQVPGVPAPMRRRCQTPRHAVARIVERALHIFVGPRAIGSGDASQLRAHDEEPAAGHGRNRPSA